MEIIFATGNEHKLKEIQSMLPDFIRIKSLNDIGFTGDIPETEPTLEGNALQKARHIYQLYKRPCFADDTGLEIEALNGAPGIYSARYAGDKGTQEERSRANVAKLLKNLDGIENRNARFRSVIAYIDEHNKEHLYEGIVNGHIIDRKIGTEGFGYDPIFIPDHYEITFAQMDLSEKNKISHRAKAFNKFAEALSGI